MVTPDGINFDGGDNVLTYHTGWTSILNYDISSYAGQNVTLRFRVSDKGDSIYDTAAIVDGISISNLGLPRTEQSKNPINTDF